MFTLPEGGSFTGNTIDQIELNGDAVNKSGTIRDLGVPYYVASNLRILGGLSASGWHTCCIFMRMMCDSFLLDSTSQGAPGVDQVKWKRPVIAGDTLTGKLTVVARRPSRSRPSVGLVTLHAELFNQTGDSVFEFQNTAMFLTRAALA